jgi:transketolase C-terminal domain/subunit
MRACVERVFNDEGLRFIFSTRSKLPQILGPDGKEMYGKGYTFTPGKDDIVRTGTAGYIVSFGDALYRSIDAAERLKQQGIDVGVINKSTLNIIDEDMMAVLGKSPMVLVVEPLNTNTGLGLRMGTWLLERGFAPKYAHIGTHREGSGGLWEHAYHQGYDSASVVKKVQSMAGKVSKL